MRDDLTLAVDPALRSMLVQSLEKSIPEGSDAAWGVYRRRDNDQIVCTLYASRPINFETGLPLREDTLGKIVNVVYRKYHELMIGRPIESEKEPMEIKSAAEGWANSMKSADPKAAVAAQKPQLGLIPAPVLVGVAACMADGAKKYGVANWREEGRKVERMTYLHAALRHIYDYIEGHDLTEDSHVCNIDSAIAGLMVMKDSIHNGTSVDNRPNAGKGVYQRDEE